MGNTLIREPENRCCGRILSNSCAKLLNYYQIKKDKLDKDVYLCLKKQK